MTMTVVFVSNLLLFPPLGVFRSRLLQMMCYCIRCWKGGVLVAVVDAPVEGRLKEFLLFIVVVDIVDGAGAGGVGAVRGGNLKK